MNDYIKWIRRNVGHECILLNFAAACISNEKSEILLQRRSDKNAWGFLGGAIEIGESAEEAVIREVEEESGLKIKVDSLLGTYTKYFSEFPNGDKAQTIVIFFKRSIFGGQLRPDGNETLELAFFKSDEAPELFNTQHQDMFSDFVTGRNGVFR